MTADEYAEMVADDDGMGHALTRMDRTPFHTQASTRRYMERYVTWASRPGRLTDAGRLLATLTHDFPDLTK